VTEVLSGCVRGTTGTVAGDCALTSTERGPPTARRARGAHDGYGVPASGAEPSPGTDRRQCPGAASAAAVSREPQHRAPGRPGDGLGGGTGSGWFTPNGAAPKRRGLTPQLCAYDRRLDKRTLIEGGSSRVSRGGTDCLTAQQVGALKALYEGPRDSAGRRARACVAPPNTPLTRTRRSPPAGLRAQRTPRASRRAVSSNGGTRLRRT
jgi:hypothetical protein